MSAPQSVIHICAGVRLDNRYEHTIYFATAEAQQEFFAGKVVKTFSAYSFLRKSWNIKVQATLHEARSWNYLFFRNGTGQKVYYYFINNIEYINESTVELALEMDVIQTHLFNFQLLPCFVERQHTVSDEIGEHTVDEGLEVGEMTSKKKVTLDPGRLCIMVMCTTNPNAVTKEQAVNALPYMYNRVFSGVKIWAISPDKWQAWANQLENLDGIGKTDAIVAMWMYPMGLVTLGGEATWNDADIASPVEGAVSMDSNILTHSAGTMPTDLDGYTPRNNKLFCYPYNFLYCTNNQGSSAVYRYERFSDGLNRFVMSGSLAPDGGVHLTPLNYNGLAQNYHEGMTLGNFPTCAWDSDVYKLWLAQNQGSNFMGMATGALKIVGGVAGAVASAGLIPTGVGAVPGVAGAGAGIATAVSGAQQIAGMLAQAHDKEIVPAQAKGGFSSSVNITNNQHAFTMYFKTLTAEMARIIDNYFTLYGYKLNRVFTPNIHARKSYTYVKTVGCQIQGGMCTEEMVKIEAIFDKGITFWTNGNKIADYSQDNSCLTIEDYNEEG